MDNSWGSSGNDYSLILHAVEDNLDKAGNVIVCISSDDDNDCSDVDESGNNHAEEEDDLESDFGGSTSAVLHAGRMEIALQLDDAKLQNEELMDKLKSQKEEFDREKDKYLRQLQFLEAENISIKSELTSRTEKYYDAKKKLQTALRSADSEKNKYLTQISQLTTSLEALQQTENSKGNRSFSQKTNAIVDENINNIFEQKLREKSIEFKQVSIKNATLQEECVKLQQQLLVARSEIGNHVDDSNIRTLQSRIRELESNLRHKNREVEKLEKSVKNSDILEENLSSANKKVLSLQENIKSYRLMESEYNTLLQEQKSWTSHFQDLIEQSNATDKNSSSALLKKEEKYDTTIASSPHVTPVIVLRLLSNVQNKCASLLRDNGSLENKVSELVSSSRRIELRAQQVELELSEKVSNVKQLESTITLLKQQVKLFEGELTCLRSLMKTFDTEIAIIGSNKKRSRSSIESVTAGSSNRSLVEGEDCQSSSSDINTLIGLKNQEIDLLRKELDSQRSANCTVLQELIADVQKLSQLQSATGGNTSSAKRVKRESESSSSSVAGGVAGGVAGTDLSLGHIVSSGEDEATEDLRRQVRLYKDMCAALKDDMYLLEKSAGLDFIPMKTKVLHLKNNPSLSRFEGAGVKNDSPESSIRSELDKQDSSKLLFVTPLEELNHLKKLVRSGQLVPPSRPALSNDKHGVLSIESTSSSSNSMDTSMNMSRISSNVNTSISAASASGGVDSQKMNQRLREVFKEKIAEYREAVYLLFGYKFDLKPVTGESGASLLQLRSMYAENSEDCLQFIQRKDQERLEIIATSFATSIDDSIMTSLRASNSVPAFLSEVTLDLFSKQTFFG